MGACLCHEYHSTLGGLGKINYWEEDEFSTRIQDTKRIGMVLYKSKHFLLNDEQCFRLWRFHSKYGCEKKYNWKRLPIDDYILLDECVDALYRTGWQFYNA